MQEYSLVVSIYGWSAVHKPTNKTLGGEFSDLPRDISIELSKLVKPSTNTLCVACTVKIPTLSPFHQWFIRQPILTHVPL